jgi:Cof subfamily protein (haloacid dehalogenase superfamily)
MSFVLPAINPTNAFDLVVCDLDGTLVQKDLSVSPAVEGVIKAIAHKTTTKVVLATGRMFPSALPYAHRFGLSTPIVTYQGAVVRDTQPPHTLHYNNPVPLPLAKALISYCQTEGLHINAYVNDTLYTTPHAIYVQEYNATSSIDPTLLNNLLDCLTEAPPKLVIIENDPQRLNAVKQQLQETYGDTALSCCQSRHNFLELTAPNTSKWEAIKTLATQWAIPTERILCIGDEENDLSMLKQAGFGIAMGNAPAYIQAQANAVTLSVEQDGAAKALAQYVLGCQL